MAFNNEPHIFAMKKSLITVANIILYIKAGKIGTKMKTSY